MSFKKNWPVPHNGRLESSLSPGQVVVIKGKVNEGIDTEGDSNPCLTINLSAAGNGYDSPTIPFHMSNRFKAKEIVFNTKKDNDWAKEQKKKLPWKAGDEFDIRIRVHDDHFEIMADQKDFAKYEHQLPITQVSHMFIDGPITLNSVSWGGKYYNVPYESGISGGFGPGKRLHVSGVPDKDCSRFAINLLTSNGDVALHVNPRFKEKEIVRNTKKSGEWGNEEKEGKFPFQKNVAFDIDILNEDYSFQIHINDESHSAFAHRLDAHSIHGISIEGDIELQSVMVM